MVRFTYGICILYTLAYKQQEESCTNIRSGTETRTEKVRVMNCSSSDIKLALSLWDDALGSALAIYLGL